MDHGAAADGGDGGVSPGADALSVLRIPEGFPQPLVPADNLLSAEKVELGRHLFYDKRLSANETQSCASCHEQARAFTDGKAHSLGSTGEETPRSAMGLTNVAYSSALTWANPLMHTLEKQALGPMFGDTPIELGLHDSAMLIERLRQIEYYQRELPRAFPQDADPFTLENVVRALASFERTLLSGASAYDRWLNGDEQAMSAAALRGFGLFNSHPFECFHCHGGFNFSDSVNYVGGPEGQALFHNTGLYNLSGRGDYPSPNTGVHAVTGKAADMGHFRAPTLRNIAVTAPFMHDGSIASLSEVLDHYAAGGRTVDAAPLAGVGHDSPLKSDLIPGFVLTSEERADLIAFLESLTDQAFLQDPRFSDPWAFDHAAD